MAQLRYGDDAIADNYWIFNKKLTNTYLSMSHLPLHRLVGLLRWRLHYAWKVGLKGSAWGSIWTAGHDVGQIGDIPMTAELMHRLHEEFIAASHRLADRTGLLSV